MSIVRFYRRPQQARPAGGAAGARNTGNRGKDVAAQPGVVPVSKSKYVQMNRCM